MEIVWEVDDGYMGKGGPHSLNFDIIHIKGLTVDEAMEVIEESIDDQFRRRITWRYMNDGGVRAAVEAHLNKA